VTQHALVLAQHTRSDACSKGIGDLRTIVLGLVYKIRYSFNLLNLQSTRSDACCKGSGDGRTLVLGKEAAADVVFSV